VARGWKLRLVRGKVHLFNNKGNKQILNTLSRFEADVFQHVYDEKHKSKILYENSRCAKKMHNFGHI